MFKPSNKRRDRERGSLLVGAFMISLALAISLAALLSFSSTSTRQAESLLSRAQLSRMAREKFTRDILLLHKNADQIKFDTSPVMFDGGEAESYLQPIPEGLKNFKSCLYLVVAATITNNSAPSPHHMRLETILELPPPPAALAPLPAAPMTPSVQKRVPVSQAIDDQLRALFPDDAAAVEEMKQQILSALRAQFGSNVESLPIAVEMNQYRDPSTLDVSAEAEKKKEEIKEEKSEGAFYMSPLSVTPPKLNPKIRVWKEMYY